MRTLNIVKIGGNIVNNDARLHRFLNEFVQLDHPKIIVHGGGNSASELCERLDIPVKMNEGRRITDRPALEVAVMVYAGLINKSIVAKLQGYACNALGLSGADLNLIPARKRASGEVDFGYVGDIETGGVNTKPLLKLLNDQMVPVFSAITHDTKGQLLNTNADTIASCLAASLAGDFEVSLTYCFEKPGVLLDIEDHDSLIDQLSRRRFKNLQQQQIIHDGMIPKVDTGFEALTRNVHQVHIKHAENLSNEIGTELIL